MRHSPEDINRVREALCKFSHPEDSFDSYLLAIAALDEMISIIAEKYIIKVEEIV